MRARYWRAFAAIAVLCSVTAVSAGGASGTPAHPAYTLATLPVYGGEPDIVSDKKGVLYDSTPSGGMILYRSANHGSSWTKATTADPQSGDTCVFVDQSNAVYHCNLNGSEENAPLQADVWKSIDGGKTWMYGKNANIQLGGNQCGTSCQPFGVDRQWGGAYIPKGKTTKQAVVLLAYHDFYGPSHIWANVSTDGGKSYGAPIDIMANFTTAAASHAAVALANSSCSTIPIGAGISWAGKHPGRMYVAWLASDPSASETGCNVTQLQAFHNIFVAYSDDHGQTWTPQLAFDAGLGHDASTPFASFTLDIKGNPYVGFTAPAPEASFSTCAQESSTGTVQKDPTCSYHMWVVWSPNGGALWDRGGGALTGTAKRAYLVDTNTKKNAQTDVYPAIAAGNPGMVDVAFLRTNEIVPTGPTGKFDPGGCAGNTAQGNPSTYPPTCQWKLYASQSFQLGVRKPGAAVWIGSVITKTPMHVGDICNLGIFCVDPNSNRHLLDFITETLDPTTGYAHIAFTDDNKVNKLRVANQVSGPTVLGK